MTNATLFCFQVSDNWCDKSPLRTHQVHQPMHKVQVRTIARTAEVVLLKYSLHRIEAVLRNMNQRVSKQVCFYKQLWKYLMNSSWYQWVKILQHNKKLQEELMTPTFLQIVQSEWSDGLGA
jgi:hypothetical protein